MKLLLASNASYAPPKGGSTRGNLMWLRHLASRGHDCRVVSASIADDTRTIADGIDIRSFRDLARRGHILREQIQEFAPDFVLVSSEDLSHVLLREAARSAPGRIVYLAHTPQFFPFGPESWNRDTTGAAVVKSACAVVAIGTHVASYIHEHLGVAAHVVHPPMYGEPPYPRFGRADQGWLLIVNPCLVKGISIFLALARRFPHLRFAGLAGWGTTPGDREEMAALPNIDILDTVPSIDEVLAKSRLLLMPSLWYEGFGLIAMESMLRGLPVLASDSGGLVEAKRDTGYVIPVAPIRDYLPEFDETNMPRPILPEQDLSPWVAAIERLTMDPAEYARESDRAREAALRFVSSLHVADFEKLLLSLDPPKTSSAARNLTQEQKALLARRLRERGRTQG